MTSSALHRKVQHYHRHCSSILLGSRKVYYPSTASFFPFSNFQSPPSSPHYPQHPINMFMERSLLLFLLFLSVVLLNQGNACSSVRTRLEFLVFYSELRGLARSDSSQAAGMLRAGFHDCITARHEKPDSGCNGSLRLPEELSHPNNARLQGPVAELMRRKARYTCVSAADAFMIGFAASTYEAGGGYIFDAVVNENSPRQDSLTSDYVGNILDLPPVNDRSFQGQLSFYKRKNFDERDLVISLVVGHSIGGAQNQKTSRVENFTETSPSTVNADYCGGLLSSFLSSEESNPLEDLISFNFIAPDFALIDKSSTYNGVDELRKYCIVRLIGENEFILKFDFNSQIVKSNFRQFATKLQALSGRNVQVAPLPKAESHNSRDSHSLAASQSQSPTSPTASSAFQNLRDRLLGLLKLKN